MEASMPDNKKQKISRDTSAVSNDTDNPEQAEKGAADKAVRPRNRAVVVGINDYQGDLNDLPSCVNDATAIKDMLSKKFNFTDIVLLTDQQATIKNVSSAIKNSFSNAADDDRLVLYFSGHGTTEAKNGVIEECLVLYDGFYHDDDLVKASNNLPAGALTVILDSCFSGGMEKNLFKPVIKNFRMVDRARVKAYTRTDAKTFDIHTTEQEKAIAKRRFGDAIKTGWSFNEKNIAFGLKGLIPAPQSDETLQTQLNGILMSACLETETAAASTPFTEGKSAFTFFLLNAVQNIGKNGSANSIVEYCQKMAKNSGFAQTPLIKEPLRPTKAGERSFITLAEIKVAESSAAEQLAAILGNLSSQKPALIDGEIQMNANLQALLPLVLALASRQTKTQEKSTLNAEVLLPLILPVLGIKSSVAESNNNKGIDLGPLVPILISAIGSANKTTQPTKLFGIDDAILIPAITSVVVAAIKGQSVPQSKLFGVDDAVIVPAIASVIVAAMKNSAPSQEKGMTIDSNLLPILINVLGASTHGKAQQEKTLGLDELAWVPTLYSMLTPAAVQ